MTDEARAPISGGCYCGAVGLKSTAAKSSVIHCHCGQCRALSGAAFTTWVALPRASVSISGEERLRVFEPTANCRRHFCSICGTHVFTEDRRLPQVYGVPAGVLRTPLPKEAGGHYFVDDRAAWHAIEDDGLPRFGGASGMARIGA